MSDGLLGERAVRGRDDGQDSKRRGTRAGRCRKANERGRQVPHTGTTGQFATEAAAVVVGMDGAGLMGLSRRGPRRRRLVNGPLCACVSASVCAGVRVHRARRAHARPCCETVPPPATA